MRSYSLYIVGANLNCYVAVRSFLMINNGIMRDTTSKCLFSVITFSQKGVGRAWDPRHDAKCDWYTGTTGTSNT